MLSGVHSGRLPQRRAVSYPSTTLFTVDTHMGTPNTNSLQLKEDYETPMKRYETPMKCYETPTWPSLHRQGTLRRPGGACRGMSVGGSGVCISYGMAGRYAASSGTPQP